MPAKPDHRSDPPGALAGLVSPAAERLYQRIIDNGLIRMGTGDGEIDMDSSAAHELAEADLLYGEPTDENYVQAVSAGVALQLLVSRRQQEIVTAHSRVIAGWHRLESLLRADSELSSRGNNGGDDLVEIVTDRSLVTSLSAELYLSARDEMCATSTGYFSVGLREHQVLTPPQAALFNGATYRNIYDNVFASSPAGASIIEQSVRAGEQARIRMSLPTKMLLVDRRMALVALTPTGVGGAAVIRSRPLLLLLHEWFSLAWDDPATTAFDTEPGTPLGAAQRRVLQLLAIGMSDDAIAQSADMSVRTVRRHVSTIMDMLGITTRFAAGVAATKRGWI